MFFFVLSTPDKARAETIKNEVNSSDFNSDLQSKIQSQSGLDTVNVSDVGASSLTIGIHIFLFLNNGRPKILISCFHFMFMQLHDGVDLLQTDYRVSIGLNKVFRLNEKFLTKKKLSIGLIRTKTHFCLFDLVLTIVF